MVMLDYSKFDIKTIEKWEVPEGGGAPILTMPNVPCPLHLQAPRTILGAKNWNYMRKHCYAQANDTCEVCGYCPDDKRQRQAHELYEIDYADQRVKFIRTICLCSLCHYMSIHTGRALTMYKKENPMYTARQLLDGAEHCFSIIHDWNKSHPNEEPLRVFSAWLDYMKQDELKEPMEKLIKKYDIKFYRVQDKWYNDKFWGKWRLTIGKVDHPTKFKNQDDWARAMAENNKKQYGSATGRGESKLKNQYGDELEQMRKEMEAVVNNTTKS